MERPSIQQDVVSHIMNNVENTYFQMAKNYSLEEIESIAQNAQEEIKGQGNMQSGINAFHEAQLTEAAQEAELIEERLSATISILEPNQLAQWVDLSFLKE